MGRGLFAKSLLFAVAAVVGLAAVVLMFHDAISRTLVLRLGNRVAGLDAQIGGDFDLVRAFPFIIDASDVNLGFEQGPLAGSRGRFGKVHLTLRFAPLLRGVVYLERLAVEDADVSISPAPESRDEEPTNWAGVQMPFVEDFRLEQARIRFQLDPDRPTNDLTIAQLEARMDADGQVSFQGSGDLNRDPVKLEAKVGSFQQFVDTRGAYPIELALKAPEWGLEVEVSGSLDEPLRLGGANLDLVASAPDVSPLRGVFFPHLPLSGSASLQANVSGDRDGVALSGLRLHLDDGDRLKLELSGAVADLEAARGVDLRVDAALSDRALAGFLLPYALRGMRSIDLQAGIRADGGNVRIEDLDARLSGVEDLTVTARGALEVRVLESRWNLESVALDLQFAAAVQALRAWLPSARLATGRVAAKTHVGGSAGSLSFQRFDLDLADGTLMNGSLRGDFAYDAARVRALSSAEPPPAAFVPSQGSVSIDLHSIDPSAVADLLGHTLPGIGTVAGKGRANFAADGSIRMTDVDVRTDSEHALSVSVTGALTVADPASELALRDLDLDLRAAGSGAEAVEPFTGSLPLALGPWSLVARLQGQAPSLQVTNFAFAAGSDDSVRLEVDGSIGDLNGLLASSGRSPAGVTFTGRLNAASTARLGAAIGKPFLDLGQLSARFAGRGARSRWSLTEAALAVADETGFDMTLEGTAEDLAGDLSFDAALSLSVPDPQETVARMGGEINRVSPITLRGRLQGDRGRASFAGRGDVGETNLDYRLESDLARSGMHLAGVITTPVLRPRDLLGPPELAFAASEVSDKQAAERADITDTLLLSREPLPFERLSAVDFDLEFIADKVAGDLLKSDRLHLVIDTAQDIHRAELYEVKFEDGSASFNLEVNTQTDPPTVAVSGRGSNIDLRALYAGSTEAQPVTDARFSFDIDLTGRGRSMHELASTADGSYGNVIENAKLAGLNLDLLALRTLDLLTGALKTEPTSTIECLVAKFNVEDGVARTETLYVNTPKLRAAGHGQFDLPNESMDVVFNTEAKRGLFKRKSVLRIHGPVRKLEIDTDLKGAAKGTAATGAVTGSVLFVPSIGLPVAGLSFLGGLVSRGESRPCAAETEIEGGD